MECGGLTPLCGSRLQPRQSNRRREAPSSLPEALFLASAKRLLCELLALLEFKSALKP
jgi:hypothetical protein